MTFLILLTLVFVAKKLTFLDCCAIMNRWWLYYLTLIIIYLLACPLLWECFRFYFCFFALARDRHFRMHSSAFRSRILDCHNKCKVLPSVGWVHSPLWGATLATPLVHPHTCIDYYLPLATWHLLFFSTTLKEFSSTFFSRLSTKKLPTHVEKFSLRFAIFFGWVCDMKMLWIHSADRQEGAESQGNGLGKLNLAAAAKLWLIDMLHAATPSESSEKVLTGGWATRECI